VRKGKQSTLGYISELLHLSASCLHMSCIVSDVGFQNSVPQLDFTLARHTPRLTEH